MKKAFTLIELLIVVAIIAILAAIAVPNFLEAQTRAKVSRNRADMRTVVTAIELYQIDYNRYPPAADVGMGTGPEPNQNGFHAKTPSYLTTPISYITSIPGDPFVEPGSPDYFSSSTYPVETQVGGRYTYFNWKYYITPLEGGGNPNGFNNSWGNGSADYPGKWTGAWLIYGYGPDRDSFNNFGIPSGDNDTFLPYDSSNGTISNGNIVRTQKNTEGIDPHPTTGTYLWP